VREGFVVGPRRIGIAFEIGVGVVVLFAVAIEIRS
jgi:hypothetical protein